MAKRELFKVPIFGTLIKSTNAFPVDRGAPRLETIKRSVKMLKSGKALLVFPEGTRNSKGKTYTGIALLAHKSGVPVVPTRIHNNHKIKKFADLKYVVGKPIKFGLPPKVKATKEDYKNFLDKIMEEIYSL
jgi:1-acyl-sn-glycerol-3-phosphate acyltransferase